MYPGESSLPKEKDKQFFKNCQFCAVQVQAMVLYLQQLVLWQTTAIHHLQWNPLLGQLLMVRPIWDIFKTANYLIKNLFKQFFEATGDQHASTQESSSNDRHLSFSDLMSYQDQLPAESASDIRVNILWCICVSWMQVTWIKVPNKWKFRKKLVTCLFIDCIVELTWTPSKKGQSDVHLFWNNYVLLFMQQFLKIHF